MTLRHLSLRRLQGSSRCGSLRRSIGGVLLALGLLGGPLVVHAEGVDDAQRSVDQVLDELDNLRNQLGQIDEDYGGALDRQDSLVVEIAASQARVAELTSQLGGIQSAMQQVALARFTSGDSLSLSPIFSDASTYSAAGQRTALGLVAIDTGAGDVDELQSLVDDLADEQAILDRKQQEAASLIATLDQKRKDFEALEQTYLAKEASAKAALGEAKLAAEEERRAAAVAVQAQRVRDQNNSTPVSTVAPPRGGGGNTGGGNTGGGNTGGGNTGGGNTGGGNTGGGNTGGGSTGGGSTGGGSTGGGESPPPVSGKAGIAVAAAYSQLGVPYRFAAEIPGVAFDCSGLTKWAWGRAGVSLPHQSGQQFGSSPHVPRDQVQPGDLIFYYAPIGHVGIYVGNGMLIHAPQTGDVVKVSQVNWSKVVGVSRPG